MAAYRPPIPPLGCLFSFFLFLGGWQDGECTQEVICRGGAAAREFYANECVLRTFLRIPNRLQDRVRRRRTVFDVVERNFGMAVNHPVFAFDRSSKYLKILL